MAGAVTTLSDSTFDETVASDGAPVLVDFWAEWCGPCKMIAPILEEIADEQGDALQVAKLNVDEAGDVARRFEVMSIPTLILFKDGEPVKRIVGAKPKQALLDDRFDQLKKSGKLNGFLRKKARKPTSLLEAGARSREARAGAVVPRGAARSD